MPRKASREELLEKIARLERDAVVATWMLRGVKAYPADSFVAVTSPKGFSTFLVQTDEHGAPGCIWSELTELQAGELLRTCGDNEARYAACAAGIAALRRAGMVASRAAEV